MRKNRSKLIFIALLQFLFFGLLAEQMPYDTSAIKIIELDSSFIGSYTNDPDFEYTEAEEGLSFRQSVLNWLVDKFGYLFLDESARVIRILLIAGFVLILIYVFRKAGFQKFLYSDNRLENNLNAQEITEEAGKDIEEAIANEIAGGNYRKATRFLYLKLLKLFDENSFIEWEKDKTNLDYITEIKDRQMKKEFGNLSYLYEYIWYGNFDIDQNHFEKVRSEFNTNFDKHRKI